MSTSDQESSIGSAAGVEVIDGVGADRQGTFSDSPQWADLRAQTGGLRDEAQVHKSDVDDLHHRVQDYDLSERAALKSRVGHVNLLAELSGRGMGWNDISVAVGVTLSAVRKWRTGGTCTPENRTALSRLAALLDLTEEAAIVEPAGWILTEVEHGYSTRFIDLIANGREDLVLDVAFQHSTGRAVLDVFMPSWREQTAHRFEIAVDGDGIRSLRRR